LKARPYSQVSRYCAKSVSQSMPYTLGSTDQTHSGYSEKPTTQVTVISNRWSEQRMTPGTPAVTNSNIHYARWKCMPTGYDIFTSSLISKSPPGLTSHTRKSPSWITRRFSLTRQSYQCSTLAPSNRNSITSQDCPNTTCT